MVWVIDEAHPDGWDNGDPEPSGWQPDENNPGWNLWNGGQGIDINDPGNWQDTNEPAPRPRDAADLQAAANE